MSENFLDYSKYYDLLYKDKDYKSEAQFIVDLIKKHKPSAKSILNLGCGTGKHDFLLAEAGFEVTGIDLSEQMIEIAKKNNPSKHCRFFHGDARDLKLTEKFDVVISLFHVLSYQNSNKDVSDFFSTMDHFVNQEGLCIVDYWYGPSVLSIKPEKRTKKLASHEIRVTRDAETDMNYVQNVATVNYDIHIEEIKDGKKTHLKESHPMRYFFTPEIELFAQKTKLSPVHHGAWMSLDGQPSIEEWASYSVFKK
jgi:SAM-dependent methyltransferase